MLNIFLKYFSIYFIFCLCYVLLIILLKYYHGVWSQITWVQKQAPLPTSCVTSLCLSVLICKRGILVPSLQSHCEHFIDREQWGSFPGGASKHGVPRLGQMSEPPGEIFSSADSWGHCHRLWFSLERGLLQLIHAVAVKNHNLKLKFCLLWHSPCSSLLFSWASPKSYCLIMANLRCFFLIFV